MVNVLSYFFFILLSISSLCVVVFKNTFIALLFLILSFLLTSIILFFLECEFLALMLIIIYVGAIATLLLFVLMMLETKLKNLYKNVIAYFPFGVLINVIFFIEFIHLITRNLYSNSDTNNFFFNSILNWYAILDSLLDLEIYGQFLYTQFVLQLLIVGLILFLVLIAVIFLTAKHSYQQNFKNQTSFCQLSRSYLEQNLNLLVLDLSNLENLFLTNMVSAVEYLKIQELTFLAEYFLITALFCLTLFALVLTPAVIEEKHFFMKFKYNNQLIFLLIFILVFYLVLVYQQTNMFLLTLTSFNNTIYNDQLSFVSKLIIGISSILYLIFITEYLKKQKLSNVEYYIILLIAIFGFFLLCCANDLITAYLAIELQGLAFYILASFKKSSNFSMESGVKYFVLGSLSTALFLFGTSYLYVLSGTLLLTDFKDFFIWVFSTNSAFLAANSIHKVSDAIDCYFKKSKMQTNIPVLSVNDFFIENIFQDVLVEFVYSIKNNQLNYESFIDFKNNLSKANYYNELSADQSYEFSLRALNFKESSSFFSEINKNMYVDSCLNNIYNSLQCCYFSDCVFQILNFAEFLQNNESVPEKKLLAKAELSFTLIPIINIINLNNFFLEFVELISYADCHFIFDIDFVISGMFLIVLALFFKLALAPFHFWAPDVYEGSPSSSAFFFMVISKISIFVFLLRICYSSFYSLFPYWQFYSLIIATFSVFIGAIAGLKQRKLKSLLSYSSISNMGFVLLAFSVGNFEGIQAKFYYLIVYTLGSLCIWAIILNLKLKKKMYFEKQNRDLVNLVLLYESNNILAQNLGITLFSLAGLPPTIGFFAKIGVFKALTGISMYFLALINILFSIVATFYYLRITKIIFFENILVGNLYCVLKSKKIFMINLLSFLIFFLFTNPIFLYLYSYKITLFLNKTFY